MPVIKYKTKEEELQARVDAMAKPKFATKAEEERARDARAVERAKRASQDDAKATEEEKSEPEKKSVGFLASLDTDGDGKISASEMLAGGSRALRSAGSAVSSSMASASGMDLDGDGVVTAAEVAEAARIQKEKAYQAYQATKSELNTWNELRRSGDYDELLDRMGNKLYSVKDAMSRRLEKLAKDDDSYGSEETVDAPLFEPLTKHFTYPKDRPKPLPDPDFALHIGYRDAIDKANRMRNEKLRKAAIRITRPTQKGHDGILRIGSRRRRSEAISRHELGRPQTPGTPSKWMSGRHHYPKGEGAPSPTVADRLKRGTTQFFDDVRNFSAGGVMKSMKGAPSNMMGKVQRVSFDSVESSLGKAGSSVVSSFSKVGSSMRHGLDADGDGHLTAADLAGAARASAKSMLGGAGRAGASMFKGVKGVGSSIKSGAKGVGSSIKSGLAHGLDADGDGSFTASDLLHAGKQSAKSLVALPSRAMSAGGARAPAPPPEMQIESPPARPTSAGEFFPKRSAYYVRQAPPGSTDEDKMWGAQQGLRARGLRRRLANAVRALASHVGNDHEQTKAGWLWFLERHGAWKRRFYELHGTSLIAFDGPRQWRPKEAREARRRIECGWAVCHAKLVDEIAHRNAGLAFFAPDRARQQAKEPDGLASVFLSGIEAEAPLSLTVYGREEREDVAVLFRAERDEGADSWASSIRQACLRANLNCKEHKEQAAASLLQDLATAQALTAHRRDSVFGELERKGLLDRRGVTRVKEGFVELAYLPPVTAVDPEIRQRAEKAEVKWLRAFVTLGEDAALHIGTDAAEARSHEPLIVLSLRNCAFEVDFESRKGHVELRLKTRLREVRFRPKHKVALEAWLTAMRDVLAAATRANDVPGATLMEFRPRDGPLMGKGAVESDAALATLLNAADDVLDVSLEDVLLSDEMRDAFRSFLGENDVVVDAWRSAGALLDCMRKHRTDMKHAGGKDIEASAKAADTVEDLRDQLKLVWSHKTNEWSHKGTLPEGVLKGSLHREAWEALCPVDQYGDERDVEDVLVEPLYDNLFAQVRAQCYAYLVPKLEAFRDAPKFEYVARRFLNLTEIDDPEPVSHVDDALLALQATGDALPSDDESSYDSEEESYSESYSSSEDEESLAESSLASAPPAVPKEVDRSKPLPLGRRLVLYNPVPWTLTKPEKGAPIEKTSKKDHQTPKKGNVVKGEVYVTLGDGVNEIGRGGDCAVVLHTDARCSRVHGRFEVEPHPHTRENCPTCKFDRSSVDACRKFCDECRCFICKKPARLCSDWSAHCLAASTSVQSQQRRKLWERRRLKNGEPKFEETLTARCFYVDLGSSRGTLVNGRLARGRVPLRPGDCVQIGHTSLTFAIQQAGVSKPLRCEPDSESSDDDSIPKKKPSLLKDMMRSTLSGITAKKELGIDSDQQDIDLKKAEKDTTALEGVGSKDERMKRLNAMRSKTQSAEERRKATEHMGDMGGRSTSPDRQELAKKRATSPMDELMSSRHATQEDENSFGSQGKEHSGLGFLKKAEKKKSFKWGSR